MFRQNIHYLIIDTSVSIYPRKNDRGLRRLELQSSMTVIEVDHVQATSQIEALSGNICDDIIQSYV